MKTLKRVPVTPKYVEVIPDFKTFEDNVIYISKKYGSTVHKCLCGCGEKTVLPINNIINGEDLGWQMFEDEKGLTFTPSVGNYQLPCKSHYVIQKGVANFI